MNEPVGQLLKRNAKEALKLYWHQVKRAPRDIFFFALGGIYVSALLLVPELLKQALRLSGLNL